MERELLINRELSKRMGNIPSASTKLSSSVDYTLVSNNSYMQVNDMMGRKVHSMDGLEYII